MYTNINEWKKHLMKNESKIENDSLEKTNEDVDNSTGSMKKYVVVIVMRDEWDEPTIEIINAVDEENALINAAINIGFEDEEFEGVDDVGLYLLEEYQDTMFIVKEIV